MATYARLLMLLCLTTSLHLSAASYVFSYTSGCQQAYRHIMRLELRTADSLLAREKTNQPHNLLPVYLENYIDFFRLYIHEDEARYYEILHRKKDRLRQLQKGDRTSPFYLFCQAEVRIHWAVARLKFEEYVGAFNDVRKAYKLLQANLFLHPNFPLTQKSMGVLKAIIGAIPAEYQWGAELLGMEGTIDQGIDYLEQLQRSSQPLVKLYQPEINLLLAYLTLHLEKDTDKAWQLVDRNPLAKRNLLGHFVKANIAMYTGRNDKALQILLQAPRTDQHEPFIFLDFMLGMVLSRKLEDTATVYFERFIAQYQGRNYIKEAYQKLAWLALIRGAEGRYTYFMAKVLEKGYATIDPDKAALEEAESDAVPHPLLVKARLLYDGGYYDKAFGLLKHKKRTDFIPLRDQLEFTYRTGRILQALDQIELAKSLFYATLNHNEDSKYYFAPSAALQLGLIFEAEENREQAIFYFEKCRSYSGHAYASSFDSQAKAGLQRVQ